MRRAVLLTSLLAAVPLVPEPAAARHALTGRLELPGGEPAAGVAVELLAQTSAYDFGRLILAGRHYPEPAARALTRPDGSYELEAPEAGMWHLHVAPAGYRPMELHMLVLGDRSLPALELIAETPVSVRVTCAGGKPLAGAHLRAEPPPKPSGWRGEPGGWRPAYRQAFTDERGTAEIGRGPEEALELYAIAAGHLEAERGGVRGRSVDLGLEAATPRRLRVEDVHERPVAGALVRLGERRWPIGLTDSDGLIELPLPAAGEAPVHVIGPLGERLDARFELTAGRVGETLIAVLEPARRQSGRIVDRETRRPIAGAFAWLAGREADAVRADGTGGFTLSAPADSSIRIWGAAPGYLQVHIQLAAGVAAGDTTLTLQAAVRAHGVVVDEDGRPVAEASVGARLSPLGHFSREAWQASTDLEPAISDLRGEFAIDGLHPETGYILRAGKPGYAPAELDLPNARTDTARGVRLVLERGRTATGTVVSSTGEPIAGARVRLEASAGSGLMQRVMRARALGGPAAAQAVTDDEGRFALGDLASAAYDLEATAPGYAPASIVALEISAEAAETDLGEIALEPGAAIEGRITDARGAAVEGAQVFASESEDQFAFMLVQRDREAEPAAVTDANGFFSVADRRAGGRFDLTIRRAGYARASVLGVEAPTLQPLAVRLDRASKIRGEVVDSSGRPIGGATVWVHVQFTRGTSSMSQSAAHATTSEDGRFVLEEVDPGELRLSAEAEGYRSEELASLAVEPGRDLENVRVVMRPGATVSGRVTDGEGRPVADVMVGLAESGMSFSISSGGTTDAEGRYRLEGVAPGRRTVTARHDAFQPATREIEVELGDNRLDLAFERGSTVSGQVIDEAGRPISGALVQLLAPSMFSWRGQSGMSDTTGAFSIAGVPEGTFSLQASKEGFATTAVEELEVGPGDLPFVEIRLSPGYAIVGRLLGLEPAELAGVQVMAVRPQSSVSLGLVDRDGNYRIDHLGAGDYTVHAQAGMRSRTAQATTTVVEGAAETLLDLEFEGGLTLSGVVLRGDEPLAGALVAATGTDVSSGSAGTTNSEGRFELKGLEPGRHVVSVSNFQTGRGHREELELGSDRDVVIRVEAAVVSGSVFDAVDSQPLAGVAVRLEPVEPSSVLEGFSVPATADTDSAGYFRFSQVAAGAHRVVAVKDGYAPAELSVTVIDGLDLEGLELRLEPTDGMRIFVTLPSGQPAREFSAAVLDAAGRSIFAGVYTGGREGARLSAPPGEWELLVASQNTAVSSTRIALPSDPIAIALQPQAGLEIRVPELEGEPSLAMLRLTRPDGRPFRDLQWMWTRSEWPLADGRGSVDGLAPGTWTVTVEAPNGRVWQGQVSLAAGANPELVLE